MREIKFRAWDTKNKCFFEPTYEAFAGKLEDLTITFNGELIRRTMEYPAEHESRFPNRFVLMQFTGLKDRNGNEIYEGDILENSFSRRDDFCYKVIWYSDTAQWMFDPFMKGDQKAPLLGIEEFLQDWEAVGMDDVTIEVIGNIYENPELIGGEDDARTTTDTTAEADHRSE